MGIITVAVIMTGGSTRLSALGIDAHLGDDMEEIRQVAREIMAQLRSSPLTTPTLHRLMGVLEQTNDEHRAVPTSTEKHLS